MTRKDVLEEAVLKCMQELYSKVQPKVKWENFVLQNKEYIDGPKPYEFYYLPKEVLKIIVDEYIDAYRIAPELKDTIASLIEYFNNPIRNVYINNSKSYEYFESLSSIIGEDNFKIVLEYLEAASNFYKWDSDLQSFMFSVYLGASPNSNKQAVIDNWKIYRNQDIVIDDSIYNEEYEF